MSEEQENIQSEKQISFDMLEIKYPTLMPEKESREDRRRRLRREAMRRQRNQKRKLKRYLTNRARLLVVGILFVCFVSTYVSQMIRVIGTSMEPTLKAGSHKIINKRAYKDNGPERFDIIAFELIENSDYYYIKRVIGLPGETVRIEHGSIFIDGNYLLDPLPGVSGEVLAAKVDIVLGDEEYFVLGDNREESLDSRDKNFGNVKEELIIGKIVQWD